jgi:hypothetical protein
MTKAKTDAAKRRAIGAAKLARLTDIRCAREGCDRFVTVAARDGEDPPYCSTACLRLVLGIEVDDSEDVDDATLDAEQGREVASVL